MVATKISSLGLAVGIVVPLLVMCDLIYNVQHYGELSSRYWNIQFQNDGEEGEMDDVVKPLTTAWNEADVDTKNNKRISELEASHKGQVSQKSTIEQTKHDHAPAVMATPTTGTIIIEEQ